MASNIAAQQVRFSAPEGCRNVAGGAKPPVTVDKKRAREPRSVNHHRSTRRIVRAALPAFGNVCESRNDQRSPDTKTRPFQNTRRRTAARCPQPQVPAQRSPAAERAAPFRTGPQGPAPFRDKRTKIATLPARRRSTRARSPIRCKRSDGLVEEKASRHPSDQSPLLSAVSATRTTRRSARLAVIQPPLIANPGCRFSRATHEGSQRGSRFREPSVKLGFSFVQNVKVRCDGSLAVPQLLREIGDAIRTLDWLVPRCVERLKFFG
jgi:hypothetical protein